MDILKRIIKLPDVLIEIIRDYLPLKITILLKKKNYLKNNKYIKIRLELFDNYVRDMVRKDCSFVFNEIIEKNNKKWLRTKYKYNNIIYANYLRFLESYCLENRSTNCRSVIQLFYKKHGISQNQHKNNTFINKRWKT